VSLHATLSNILTDNIAE